MVLLYDGKLYIHWCMYWLEEYILSCIPKLKYSFDDLWSGLDYGLTIRFEKGKEPHMSIVNWVWFWIKDWIGKALKPELYAESYLGFIEEHCICVEWFWAICFEELPQFKILWILIKMSDLEHNLGNAHA